LLSSLLVILSEVEGGPAVAPKPAAITTKMDAPGLDFQTWESTDPNQPLSSSAKLSEIERLP
jgi:hypothetical protein